MSKLEGTNRKELKTRFLRLRSDDKISRRELLKLALPHGKVVPFGKVELDSSQCTGCSLCATNCPTKALSVSSSKEADVCLLFQQDLCVACNLCVEVCPEKCLRLERILEPDKVNSSPVTLIEVEAVRCRQCGSIIAPRAIIDRLQVKLMAMGDSFTSQLELCTTCKVKQFGLGATLKPTTKPGQNLNNRKTGI